MSGFVAAYREALEHPLFIGNAERLGAWMWLVMRAAWKPTPYDIGGKIIIIKRGQLCTSRAQLAKAWGMSPSAVERFLTRLKTEQMIEQETGQGKSIITICNYDKYQDISNDAGQATGQATGQRPDSDRTTKEQGNKGTIDIIPDGITSKRERACEFEKPDYVEKQVWADFLKNRKTKRLSNTATAHKNMLNDVAKISAETGWPPGQVFEACVAKGWGAIFNPIDRQGGQNGNNGRTGNNQNGNGRPVDRFDAIAADRAKIRDPILRDVFDSIAAQMG